MTNSFPNCIDFIAMYGCDSVLNEDYEQITTFHNGKYKLVIITTVLFNHSDIKLYENHELIIHMYEEGVENIKLLEDSMKILFIDNIGCFDKKSIDIILSPRFFIDSISMRK